ncbi:MAG: DEAD/DEAH box helicase [Bacteroidota bacterium]
MASGDILNDFHPVVRAWFRRTYSGPTPPQELGWPPIGAGKNTLILAPTGSGKTLAAFLWAINHLVDQHAREQLSQGVRILYVSPLKALNNDIERNLRAPLTGIHEEAVRHNVAIPEIRAAVRTGDTPPSERQAMVRHPPDILITTPESLYLMLTSTKQRGIFRSVQYVIVDEIHSVCSNKRGVHLSLSLERLQALADQEFIRIGLSATQRPLDAIAAFLGGRSRNTDGSYTNRPVVIVDAGRKKSMDIRVSCPLPDFSLLPDEGAWPSIFEFLFREIQRHTTTLIFVNNRRLAERIATKLNQMAAGIPENDPAAAVNLHAVPALTGGGFAGAGATGGGSYADGSEVFVQAYHGSMAREARESMERALKEGNLRALVATSSLELGIDIGSIDLVVQVESPKSVSRGLQRIGRSGHLVHATSKGRIVPTHREDLVESAVVAAGIRDHEVEATSIPENCLDVLAQQIVAMVAVDPWDVDALYNLVLQSSCYRNLTRPLFESVVGMLAGRYSSQAFGDLRARISWDIINGTLHPLPGTSHLAITGGGTIADRGYYGVYLEDARTKVGEVDEEFVYESRPGDTFILGSSVWRMTSIDANRVYVSPAPGQPARMPFWKGEGIGRSFDLGEQVGAFRRLVSNRLDDPGTLEWLQEAYPLDADGAWNILDYFRRQRDATGVLPDDRTLLVENTRDEIGDPRIIVHSSYGRRVNGLIGLLLARRVAEAAGARPEMLYNDDGILLRVPEGTDLARTAFSNTALQGARETVVEEVLSSPLFAGQFRQNAARALLMPKPRPGKRLPLWVQRIRAGDLFQAVRQHEDFPIVLETIREVFHDVLDLSRFLPLVDNIASGRIRVETVVTETPSPFAAGLLFAFLGASMYAGDSVPGGSGSPTLHVNAGLLDDIIAGPDRRAAFRPEAVAAVEARLQHAAPGYQARSAEELMQVLLRIGDLDENEIVARCAGDTAQFVRVLEEAKRIAKIPVGNAEKWVPAEYAGMYSSPHSLSNAELIVRRYLQGHGPVRPSELVQRYGFVEERIAALRSRLVDGRQIIHGRFGPGEEEEWCFKRNVEQIHRQSISLLRKEITPVPLRQFAHFLQRWTGFAREQNGGNALACIEQMQGLPLPADCWERDILRPRNETITGDSVGALTRNGTIIWTGLSGGRMRVTLRGNGALFLSGAGESMEAGSAAGRVVEYLSGHGASFFSDIRSGTGLSLEALNNALAELFWNAKVSNDIFHELLNLKRAVRESENPMEPIQIVDPIHNPSRSALLGRARKSLRQVPGWSGRWFLTNNSAILGETMDKEEQAFGQARQLLARYGVFAREFLPREECLTWSTLGPAFQVMELRGEIRRGYFVEGLSGMQYALPDAADEIRAISSRPVGSKPSRVVLLAACDPANPFGPGVNLPCASGAGPIRISRSSGNYLAFLDGSPILLMEGCASRLYTIGDADESSLESALRQFLELLKLPDGIRPAKEITIEYWDDLRPATTPSAAILQRLGFQRDRNQTYHIDAYSF